MLNRARKQMLKDGARALSLANLCFIAIWAALLNEKVPWQATFSIYAISSYTAAILNVLALTGLFWGLTALARRSNKESLLKLTHLAFPLVLLVPLNGILRMLLSKHRLIIEISVIVLAVIVISLADIYPWNRKIIRFASAVALALFPFTLFTVFQALWVISTVKDDHMASPVAATTKQTPRVVWFVFDEMDQQIALSNRPGTLHLPELDRLREQSIYAANAFPPGDSTLTSMPAIIAGRTVLKAEAFGPSEVMITFRDSEKPVRWSSQPSIFSRAREAGVNAAIVGWYFPYCRIMRESVVSCSWQDLGGSSLQRNVVGQVEGLVDTIPMASIFSSKLGIFEKRRRQQMRDTYRGVLSQAKMVLGDPDIGLVLIHWPVPHPPSIYDRHEDDFDLSGRGGYLGNLWLADRTLGEIRQVMQDSGTWDETVLLVTSDHWWKCDYWRSTYVWTREDEEVCPKEVNRRVPFLLKLAGQKEGVEYDTEFNTVVTHDLLLGLLKGELSSPASVVNWLDHNRSIGDGPYQTYNQR